MRKVYICSPYRAKDGAELDRNIDYVQQLTRQALEAGLAPITPHLYMTQCMDDKKPEERARGMAAGLALLKGCDFVIAGVKYGITEGKRWNCSKNLVRPEPEYHIISDREYFKKEPKAIKGYYVDKNSVSMGVHSPEYYGYGYLRYTLVKITDKGG